MATKPPRECRCAIYTRKSSDEGLEQAFNSLDAQYEACAAYIASQVHEGWKLIRKRYDDGGISGGTMERPGLRNLLADIEAGRIDVIVVYKVDRLTRSLADFAKMVEIFDKHDVSFVSITQQFNTTSSMGRLTLNVLLSFAQFEREVTGERIRDKIAASKKKGMWMGGNVALGYDVIDRKLIVNEEEAEAVRTLFRLYLEKGNVREVVEQAKARDIRTKARTSRNGNRSGGGPLGRGHLYWLLKNPVYIGQTRHRDKTWPGEHRPIVDQETWNAVQALLSANHHKRRSASYARAPSLLAGLLFDSDGKPFTASHAVKNGRRYRYYVDRSLVNGRGPQATGNRRIPAHDIDKLVADVVSERLRNTENLFSILGLSKERPTKIDTAIRAAGNISNEIKNGSPSRRREIVIQVVNRVMLTEQAVRIALNHDGLRTVLGLPASPEKGHAHIIDIGAEIRSRGVELKLIINDPSTDCGSRRVPALIRAVIRANDWWHRLSSGESRSIATLARNEGLNDRYVSRHLPLAFLAPDITKAILDGQQPPDLSLEALFKGRPIPVSWTEQRRIYRFRQG